MEIHNCEQGSDEWFALKLGKVSASHFKDVLNKAAGRKLYMYRLLGERLSGETCNSYSNKAMENGIELEPQARNYYESLYGVIIQQVGFVEENDYLGCSPDGLIDADGGVEIKCPYPSTHISYIDNDRLPAVYKPQVQGHLWVTGRKWWDFISYCPQIKARPFWKKRVYRDEKYLNILSIAVEEFICELKELEEQIVNKKTNF